MQGDGRKTKKSKPAAVSFRLAPISVARQSFRSSRIRRLSPERHHGVAGGAQRPRLLASALALVQLCPAWAARDAALPVALQPRLCVVHVRPIKAANNREKPMTIFDIALLISAVARLVAAFARFFAAFRRRQ